MKHIDDPTHPISVYAHGWFRRRREERCSKCGTKIANFYKYCPECGTQLKPEDRPKASEKDLAILGILSLIIGFPICMIFFTSYLSIPESIVISLFLSIPVGFTLLWILTIIHGIFQSKKKKQT